VQEYLKGGKQPSGPTYANVGLLVTFPGWHLFAQAGIQRRWAGTTAIRPAFTSPGRHSGCWAGILAASRLLPGLGRHPCCLGRLCLVPAGSVAFVQVRQAPSIVLARQGRRAPSTGIRRQAPGLAASPAWFPRLLMSARSLDHLPATKYQFKTIRSVPWILYREDMHCTRYRQGIMATVLDKTS
jgi:hypothetical protein